MKNGWVKVPLGEVLNLDVDAVTVDPTESYPFAGVFGFGRGLFIRESVSGSDTTYKYFHRLHQGQLVMSQPKGWEGAITVVPKEFEGRFLSSVFPTFRSNQAKLTSEFLHIITKCRWLWDALFDKSSGIGARRNSVYPAHLFEIEIPIPPIVEQQRIVAHLDTIQERLNRVKSLRKASAAESLALIRSLIQEDNCSGLQHVPMHDLVDWRSPDTIVSQTENYSFAGVYSFGRGVFRKGELSGTDFAYDRLTRLRAGEFTYPKLMAWEGALGIVPNECDGCHVSPEFPVFTVDQSRVLPEILDIHFKTPAVWKKLADISTGTNLRRRRLNPNAFLGYTFPLPPMEVQKKVKCLANQAAIKRDLQNIAMVEEEALLLSILDQIFNC